jgi:hypothetical protein
VKKIKDSLIVLLEKIKQDGKTITGYGAAAKATTLLSYCGIDKKYLDYIVDLNNFKHGKYMGVNHIPIFPTNKIIEEKLDYVLILAWNFANEIIEQQKIYKQNGGKFIIPIPEVKIV